MRVESEGNRSRRGLGLDRARCGHMRMNVGTQDVGDHSVKGAGSRGFPHAANRITIAGMDWHPTPKDDAWKQAHLAMLERLGKDTWLRCDECAHTVMVKPQEFAERHRLDMFTPLLTISRRMRCTRCGARKGGCRPAPHDTRASEKKGRPD
jgi:DNA-directed RNA polymerase subunit RPC12/RpoP